MALVKPLVPPEVAVVVAAASTPPPAPFPNILFPIPVPIFFTEPTIPLKLSASPLERNSHNPNIP